MTVYTIGHSTRTIADFSALLSEAEIQLVVDVRAIPRSRTNPQFNSDVLPASLADVGIGYQHIPELGGRRHRPRGAPPSPNTFWRNDSFRNYADYATTDTFNVGFTRLRELAQLERCALMCSEAVWWRCHRSMIADYLKAGRVRVLHIMGPGDAPEHPYTAAARLAGGRLTYEGPQ